MNFYNATIQEVNARYIKSEWVENYNNGIGRSEGAQINFFNKPALEADGFVETGWLEFTNHNGIKLRADRGEMSDAHYLDPYFYAVTNQQNTLLCGRMAI